MFLNRNKLSKKIRFYTLKLASFWSVNQNGNGFLVALFSRTLMGKERVMKP